MHKLQVILFIEKILHFFAQYVNEWKEHKF